MERSARPSVDDGLSAQLPDRGADLRQANPADQAERENRRAVPERRLWQGLLERSEGRPGRQGGQDDRRRSLLRGDRPDHRLADGATAGLGRRCVHQHRHPEVRVAGDPQSLRQRLEAGPVHEQHDGLRRCRADTGRSGQVGRGDQQPVWQGPDRPDLGERRRNDRMARVHEEVLPRG